MTISWIPQICSLSFWEVEVTKKNKWRVIIWEWNEENVQFISEGSFCLGGGDEQQCCGIEWDELHEIWKMKYWLINRREVWSVICGRETFLCPSSFSLARGVHECRSRAAGVAEYFGFSFSKSQEVKWQQGCRTKDEVCLLCRRLTVP